MSKKILSMFLVMIMSVSMVSCSKATAQVPVPEEVQMRDICELATMECYYHNVAKINEEDAEGILFWKKDKKFWIEYDGIIKLGIDASQLAVTMEENIVHITIPEAKILSVDVNPDSIEYIFDTHSAKIEPEDEAEAFKRTQEDMTAKANNNASLLVNAQDNAKKLLEDYIMNIGELTETEYQIVWETVKTDVPENNDVVEE